jgi:triacylglycerol lipase
MTPVVLHHGLLGHGNLSLGPLKVRYFKGIDAAIEAAGHPVIVAHVHPTSTVETRAIQLKEMVLGQLAERNLAGQKVIIMAHSMGGLDARYAVARLGMDRHVSAVVTVTTPHRGSPFAGWVVRNLGRVGILRLAKVIGVDLGAGDDLTTEGSAALNEKIPDVPGIKYVSVSASRPWNKMPPFALHAHRVISAAEGENDGLVSVQSSVWGDHRGTWAADHWHTINRRYSIEFGRPTGDIAPHWVSLLKTVAAGLPAAA